MLIFPGFCLEESTVLKRQLLKFVAAPLSLAFLLANLAIAQTACSTRFLVLLFDSISLSLSLSFSTSLNLSRSQSFNLSLSLSLSLSVSLSLSLSLSVSLSLSLNPSLSLSLSLSPFQSLSPSLSSLFIAQHRRKGKPTEKQKETHEKNNLYKTRLELTEIQRGTHEQSNLSFFEILSDLNQAVPNECR